MSNYEIKNKLNKGFTLIEVLVAVIILTIISIPIFRALVTSFNTTSKSSMKMNATNAAENVMEDIKALSVKGIIEKYGKESSVTYETPNVAGKNVAAGTDLLAYEMKLTSASKGTGFNADIDEALNKEYEITVRLDPTYYSNANKRNLSEYNTVSSTTAAIYSMNANADEQAYKKFGAENTEYRRLNPDKADKIPVKNYLWFGKNVKRLIWVDITSDGALKDKDNNVVKDEDGNEVPAVSVYLTVSYLLPHELNQDIIPEEFECIETISRQIFDNSTNYEPFSGVFIMYNPRLDTEPTNTFNDIILVQNQDEVEGSLYIIAQNSNSPLFEDYKENNDGKGLILEVYEDKVDDKEHEDEKKHPLKLFTNLLDDKDIEKYRDDKMHPDKDYKRQAPALCYLNVDKSVSADIEKNSFKDIHSKLLNNKGKYKDQKTSYELKTSTLDGMTGDASTIESRIYDVEVTVTKSTGADEWPVSVTLTGTVMD